MTFSTAHTRDTDNPQTYAQHFRVAWWGSWRLIWFGLAGLVHAVLPEFKPLQFYTSSGIIGIYRELEESGRHADEIKRILGDGI
jgi:hypothetical protein